MVWKQSRCFGIQFSGKTRADKCMRWDKKNSTKKSIDAYVQISLELGEAWFISDKHLREKN